VLIILYDNQKKNIKYFNNIRYGITHLYNKLSEILFVYYSMILQWSSRYIKGNLTQFNVPVKEER